MEPALLHPEQTADVPRQSPRRRAIGGRGRAIAEACIATLAMVLVGTIALVGLYRSAVRSIKSELHDDLVRIASATASLVDGDAHRLINDPAMIDGELYNRIIQPLRQIRSATPGVKYIYTAVRDGGDVRFILDAAIPGDHDHDGREDRAQILEIYRDAEPAIRVALGAPGKPGAATASPEPYTDEWGAFVTGYAPFFDAKGAQVGVVGVDVAAGVYLARLAEARRTTILGVLPAALATVIIGFAVYADRRRTHLAAQAIEESSAALAASEARARALIEGSDIILWEYMPARGVFTYVSPQAERLGYPLSEWFRPGFWEDHVHPEDRENAINFCREETHKNQNHRLHYRMIKPDGSCVWMDDVVSVSRDAHGNIVLRGVFVDITERKNAEDRLRELYERLQKIASQVPGVVYQYRLRPDGTSSFPYASDGIRQIYRLEPGEVRADASRVFDIIHPDDRDAVRRSIDESAHSLQPWRSEFRVRFPDGEVRWLLGNSVPQRESDGSVLWHGFITDITDRRRDEERLGAAIKRFELARKSVSIGVWEWDIASENLEWDEGMRELFDIDDPALAGPFDAWRLRAHPDDLERVQREFAAAVAGAADFDTTFRVVHRDASVHWLASHGVAIRDASGAVTRLVGLNIDITRQLNAQEALAKARDQAEAANRAKSLFLANMSHEIRTPLTAILGYADLLRDECEAAEAPAHRLELIDTIRSAGRHLLNILNDILDLSKIEAERMSVERVEVNLPALLADVETLLRPRAAAKGIALSIIPDTPVPERIMGDPTRLRQVLTNLAGNAVKFTESGAVSVRLAARAGKLTIDVEDTGVGMTADQAAQLFQPFAQADPSVTRRHGGTGLGLAICRRLAHLMGGEVTLVRTAPGQGSIFRLDLPLERAPHAREIERLDEEAESPPSSDSPAPLRARVLLAEDAPENQRLIAFYLRRAGAELEIADNGAAALRRIDEAESTGRPFQLLITDVQMPEMDGCTLARLLRERGTTIPIIALTAHAMNEDRDRCLAAGCNAYATKPIDPRTLVRLCATMVSPPVSQAAVPR